MMIYLSTIWKDANDTAEQARFFGAYAYLIDTFKNTNSDLVSVKISDSIERIKIKTEPFSDAELKTISEYENNYLSME